jgi:hypothetical protein
MSRSADIAVPLPRPVRLLDNPVYPHHPLTSAQQNPGTPLVHPCPDAEVSFPGVDRMAHFPSDSSGLLRRTFDPSILPARMPTGKIPPDDLMPQHRGLPGCTIAPMEGQSLRPGWSLEQAPGTPGTVRFETVAVGPKRGRSFANWLTRGPEFAVSARVAVSTHAADCREQGHTLPASFRVVERPSSGRVGANPCHPRDRL